MYKLVLIIAMMSVWLTVHMLQIEQEMSMKTLFLAKQAINRSAHAAVQQLDMEALGKGIFRIDEEQAVAAANQYLQTNLQLDSSGMPLQHSFLRHQAKLLVFEIINEGVSFPYYYRNASYDYNVMLYQPGVIMIVEIQYPRAFQVMVPIIWQIKGTAEMTLLNHLT